KRDLSLQKDKAERGGFEPPVRFDPHTAFPVPHNRPLCHLSLRAVVSRILRSTADSVNSSRIENRGSRIDDRITILHPRSSARLLPLAFPAVCGSLLVG